MSENRILYDSVGNHTLIRTEQYVMSVVLLISIGIRLLAMIWSLLLLYRLKDWRVGFLSLMLGLMATRQILTILSTSQMDRSLSLTSHLEELPGLIVSIFALLAVFFLAKILTENKRATQNLLLLERAVNSSLNGILITDALKNDHPIIFCNSAFEQITGYTADEVLGRNCRFLQRTSRDQPELDIIRRGLHESKPAHAVLRNYRKDGTPFWNERSIAPITDRSGQVTHFVGVQNDISQRKKIEEEIGTRDQRMSKQQRALLEISNKQSLVRHNFNAALNAATETTASTLEVARVSIWLYQNSGAEIHCIDLYERGAHRHTSGNQLQARNYPAYFKALKENRVIAVDNAHQDRRTCEFSKDYLTPLGITSMLDAPLRRGGKCIGVICHEATGIPRSWTPDEQLFAGAVADLVSLTLEISSFIKAEEALKRSHEFLEQRVKDRTAELTEKNEHLRQEMVKRQRIEMVLRTAKEQAEQADRSKSRFVAAASHDLRQPLQSLRSYLPNCSSTKSRLNPRLAADLCLLSRFPWAVYESRNYNMRIPNNLLLSMQEYQSFS